MPLLELAHISRAFPPRAGSSTGPVRVLDDVSLAIEPGETVALVGRSGAGKTTLLYIAGGLARADAGTVSFEGRVLSSLSPADQARWRRREVGLVFQNNLALSALPVWENAALPLLLEGLSSREARSRAAASLERVGLAGCAGEPTSTLSGGQRRRLGLARAMIARPRLLLADEPTADLDEATGAEIERLLSEWLRETQAAALLVTHTPSIERIAHRSLRLEGGKLAEAVGNLV